MALRDLINPITDAYGKSATGFDYGEVRGALKEDRDFKREKIKSFYDITADLDAAAFSAMKSQIDEIGGKIDSNELKVNTPEFQQMMGRMKATAGGLKETQDLVKKVSQEYAKDPNKFAYISGDKGREIDEGFEGFMRRMSEASSKEYKTPEEYIQSLTSEIGRVQNKIDERLVAQDIQKIISDELKLAEQATGISEKVPRITIGNKTYVNVPLNIVQALERSKQKAVQMFPNAGLQLAASQRGMGNLEARGRTNEQYMEQAITDMFPTDLLKQYEITAPKPTQESFTERKAKAEYARTQERFKDIKADVKAFQNGDTTALDKYLPSHISQIKDGQVLFAEIGKTKDEPTRVVARVPANDAAAIYQAIADLSSDSNMVIEAINAAPAVDPGPEGETPKQVNQRVAVDKMFQSLNPPKVDSDGVNISEDKRKEEREKAIQKFKDLGVEFIDESDKFRGKDKVKIDGITYELTDPEQAKQANLKIKEKISGKQAESRGSKIPEITSEAEYNNLKPGDKYVWGGKEYTKK